MYVNGSGHTYFNIHKGEGAPHFAVEVTITLQRKYQQLSSAIYKEHTHTHTHTLLYKGGNLVIPPPTFDGIEPEYISHSALCICMEVTHKTAKPSEPAWGAPIKLQSPLNLHGGLP